MPFIPNYLIWLVAVAALVALEAATLGLTCIWFALGALGALLCGACAVLGVVLLALEPTAANLVALLLALALAASGCAIARRA